MSIGDPKNRFCVGDQGSAETPPASMPAPYSIWIFIVLLVLLGLAHEALSAEGSGDVSDLLQDKMESIQVMTDKIARQQQEADQLRRRLTSERDIYAEEIVTETRRIGAASLKLALLSPRIEHNLELVGWLDAYLKALAVRAAFYDAGIQRLKYLHAKASDDLKLVRTFAITSADQLVADIDGALNQYHLAATAPLFDVHHVSPPDTETVWKTIVREK